MGNNTNFWLIYLLCKQLLVDLEDNLFSKNENNKNLTQLSAFSLTKRHYGITKNSVLCYLRAGVVQ
jgi:hypothetical protein